MNVNGPERPAVLLERDGVITRRTASGVVRSWSEIEFLPGALEGLRLFAEHGYRVVVFCKHRCVDAGGMSGSELQTVTRRLLLETALAGGDIAEVYYCSHAPEVGCSCGTARIGLLRKVLSNHAWAPEQTYLISDAREDLEAGWLCGCPTIFLRRTSFLRAAVPSMELCEQVVSNLREAAEHILNHQAVRTGPGLLQYSRSEVEPYSRQNVNRLLMELNLALGR
jgi:D-glycero-D-manno-heptose 1,7-bisphosphate phosphatase